LHLYYSRVAVQPIEEVGHKMVWHGALSSLAAGRYMHLAQLLLPSTIGGLFTKPSPVPSRFLFRLSDNSAANPQGEGVHRRAPS